jgi:lipopolysaccharide/colanic/teichoic acid biosynthesis glycosyltransferase
LVPGGRVPGAGGRFDGGVRRPRGQLTAPVDAAKRVADIVVAALALVLLAPVLAVIALAVRVVLGPPVLFRQVRPGLGGRPFVLRKFRTLRPPARPGAELTDDSPERETRLGRCLRASGVDELPELVNVLRGDMSLVGPRPLLTEYLPLYSAEQARRHDVRPGITGLAQVSGATDWAERLALDVRYVRERSLALDLRILVRTVGAVLRRDGGTGGAPFTGTAPFAGGG